MNLSRVFLKRIKGDMNVIRKDPIDYIDVYVNNNDLLCWFFLIKGPENTVYSGGYYIGKIILTPEYPFKPPDFIMLTPSGRFIPEHKICLSNTSFHSSEWTAMWSISSILKGFLSIMLDDEQHGISHIHYDDKIKKKNALESIEHNIKHHPDLVNKFPRFLDNTGHPIINNNSDHINISSDNSNTSINNNKDNLNESNNKKDNLNESNNKKDNLNESNNKKSKKLGKKNINEIIDLSEMDDLNEIDELNRSGKHKKVIKKTNKIDKKNKLNDINESNDTDKKKPKVVKKTSETDKKKLKVVKKTDELNDLNEIDELNETDKKKTKRVLKRKQK